MDDHDLDGLVHAALDARRDPLADPARAGNLADSIETLERVVALRAALSELPELLPTRRASTWRLGTAAAALVAITIALTRIPATPRPSSVLAELRVESTVLEYRISRTREEPFHSERWVVSSDGARERIVRRGFNSQESMR